MNRRGIPSLLLAVVALLVSAEFTLKVVVPPRPPIPSMFLAQHVFEFVAKTVTPYEVVVGSPPVIEEPPVIMERPARWCAPPRRPEPLLNEAARMAWGHETDPDPDGLSGEMNFARDYLLLWRAHVDKSDVYQVHDEAICERAARLYDEFEYATAWREQHPAFNPVVVVKMGAFYLVDDRRPRRLNYWGVVLYDANWTYAGSYGRNAGN